MQHKKVALVVGASGIIGNAVTQALIHASEWKVRATRRALTADVEILNCDALDAAETQRALLNASDTTHVFFAAYVPDASALKESKLNTAMLRNILNGLNSAGAKLERVILYQGAKVYGGHLGGPVSTPFYEDTARHLPENFYFAQEDLLRERALSGEFDWSILRPDAVLGDIAGNPMNIALVIAAFAALSKQANVALRFPGSLRTYDAVLGQLTDARWLGRASVWAATAESARNQAFNIVGEPFRWRRLWNKLGEAMNMAVGEPQPFSMTTHMPDKAEAWRKLVSQNNLKDIPYQKLVNWGFGDFLFNVDQDLLSDMGKIRRAGFTEPMDTEASLIETIASLREQRYVP